MFGLGTMEILMIMVTVLILFGAKRLPQLGRGMGQGIKDFKKALKETDEDEAGSSGELKNVAPRQTASEPAAEAFKEAEEAPAGK